MTTTKPEKEIAEVPITAQESEQQPASSEILFLSPFKPSSFYM